MAKNEMTSHRVAKVASKVLKSTKETSIAKATAGSALTQAKDKVKKS